MNFLNRVSARPATQFGGTLNPSQEKFLSLHHSRKCSSGVNSQYQEVVIALGSNVGDRVHNLREALRLMRESGINITRHGCLYETEPAYVTNQPLFLNSAISGFTKLPPHELLGLLKNIEKDIGRTDGVRYGPRPIDLDILFYGYFKINSEDLTIPHERIFERLFVMAPLVDLLGLETDSDVVASWHSSAKGSGGLLGMWERLGGESLIGHKGIKRVLPIGGCLLEWSKKTSVMGILNLTPDSFSDGGKFQYVDDAISHVRSMISDGVDMIDIGAQSTRPMASMVSPKEELDRLIPVLESVRRLPEVRGMILSVDTFYSEVAVEAVKRGVHLVNDISGGCLDSKMHSVVANIGVPYIAMHMRGNPSTMMSSENIDYDNVCNQVAAELYQLSRDAELSGIPAWGIILDPGIGFSKTTRHNIEILAGIRDIRAEIAKKSLAMSHAPITIGPSRKRFLGEICSRSSACERDPATIAAITAGVLGGANIVRVHNVRYARDAVRVCDTLIKHKLMQKSGSEA